MHRRGWRRRSAGRVPDWGAPPCAHTTMRACECVHACACSRQRRAALGLGLEVGVGVGGLEGGCEEPGTQDRGVGETLGTAVPREKSLQGRERERGCAGREPRGVGGAQGQGTAPAPPARDSPGVSAW